MHRAIIYNHIQKNENNLLMRRVLDRQTTFQLEVCEFYGVQPPMEIPRKVAPTDFYDRFHLKRPPHSGSVPGAQKELVTLINGFEPESELECRTLDCEAVRRAVQRKDELAAELEKKRVSLTHKGISFGLSGGAGVTIGGGYFVWQLLQYAIPDMPTVQLPPLASSALAGLGMGGAALLTRGFSQQVPPNIEDVHFKGRESYDALVRLYARAGDVDAFIHAQLPYRPQS